MKRYSFKHIILGAAFLSLSGCFSSCTKDFEKINTDPNGVTKDMAGYDNLDVGGFFPRLQKAVIPIGTAADDTDPVNQYQISCNLAGDGWGGYLSPTQNKFNSGNNFTTYFFTEGWGNYTYEIMTTKIYNPWFEIKKKAEGKPEILALAQVIKIAGIHRTTDMFGPIPYSAIGKGGLTVRYDSQQEIYKSFFTELTDAVEVLNKYSATSPTVLAKYDAVYGGDVKKWIKFANSLMLRLAVRVSVAEPEMGKKYAEQAVNHPVGVISSKDETAKMRSGAGMEFRHPLKTIWEAYGDTRMGASIESYMKGYNDPRISAYFKKSNAGGSEGYYGVRIGIPAADYSAFSVPNVEYDTPLYWLTESEVCFLRAEGALRGWNMGGSAQSFYEKGIAASFAQYNLSNASEYIGNSKNKPADYTDFLKRGQSTKALGSVTIKWNDGESFNIKLEKIVTQKWIALFPNGQEAWSEFRRTGYPRLFPVLMNRSNGSVQTDEQVKRMPYPVNEYKTNNAEVLRGIQLLGGPDLGSTKLWWEKR